MLKAHQVCIDLEKNVLQIQGREVRFLSEHELPDKARNSYEPGLFRGAETRLVPHRLHDQGIKVAAGIQIRTVWSWGSSLF